LLEQAEVVEPVAEPAELPHNQASQILVELIMASLEQVLAT
jgi:hypothetical protein